MRRSTFWPEPDCAVAQSLAVIGDGWDLLVVRDLARGLDRSDLLAGSPHMSRKVLTERPTAPTAGIVKRSPYQHRHGCTLENRLFRDRPGEFVAAGISVHGVNTQRPDGQRGFAELEGIPHPLLSDVDRRLTAALRLPTFRVADTERLKRLPDRVVRAVRCPVTDLAATVDWACETAAQASTRPRTTRGSGP